MSKQKIFIIGCGYVGMRLAAHLRAEAVELGVLARSAESRQRLLEAGLTPWLGDLDRPPLAVPVADAVVYYMVPPPAQGRSDPRLAAWLEGMQGTPAKSILISTTGVYGDCGGDWIDETRLLAPRADRAWRRVDAERQLQEWCGAHGVPWVILRVPGIYGPWRLPRARLAQGAPVLAEAESPYSNRIHVDDLVRACVAAAETGKEGIFHVSDGHPTTMTDYFKRTADALGLPCPPEISRAVAERQLSREMLGYLAESKRLEIRKMREELGVEPRYADLNAGLAQCLKEEIDFQKKPA